MSSNVFPFVWTLLLDIRNWIRNIEQHASDNVNKILVGNKADMDESKRVISLFLCFCVEHHNSGLLWNMGSGPSLLRLFGVNSHLCSETLVSIVFPSLLCHRIWIQTFDARR